MWCIYAEGPSRRAVSISLPLTMMFRQENGG